VISEWVREKTRRFLEPLAQLMGRAQISPNLLTMIGLLLNMGVAYLLARGQLRIGGSLLTIAGLCDALDGALARSKGRSSHFGAFLDSTLDRFSEAIIYLGLLIFCLGRGARLDSLLVYIAIVGSLIVSYTRARAEGLGIECKVGLLTRFERIVVLILGLLTQRLTIALWILAVLSLFTALQRIYHVWRVTKHTSQ